MHSEDEVRLSAELKLDYENKCSWFGLKITQIISAGSSVCHRNARSASDVV